MAWPKLMSCKHASRLISQSLDRPLSWRERVSLRLHLSLCDMCTRFQRQLHVLRTAVRQLTDKVEQDDSLQLPQQARQRIAQALDSKH